MNIARSSCWLSLVAAAASLTGCAFYAPLNLVGSNLRPSSEPLISGSRRVEAQICGNRLLGIPFGPDPRIASMMEAFQADAPSAVGFEDIQIDVVRVIYPFFWQDCVHGSATPLFPVTKRPTKVPPAKVSPPAKVPPPAEAPAPPAEAPSPPTPPSSAEPFQQ
jgi:hypothetical protein